MSKISMKELRKIFDIKFHLRNIDSIFKKVLKNEKKRYTKEKLRFCTRVRNLTLLFNIFKDDATAFNNKKKQQFLGKESLTITYQN